MGIFDALLGGKRKLKAPAKDRLFAAVTAYVAMESRGITSAGSGAIVFQPLATADFKGIQEETEQLLAGAAEETGTAVEWHEDEFKYRWAVLRDPDFDDLVVAVNTVSGQLQAAGYGDRLLAAVFALQEEGARRLYLIYNFKRGAWYPFVPVGKEKKRDNERELRLKAELGAELPWEAELTRWFPLWDVPL